MATIKVGCPVMWCGSWGRDTPKKAVVKSIERTEEPNQKEGTEVKEVGFSVVDGGWEFPFICTLNNGHWAYSHQVVPYIKGIHS
jgi:hypothetical protein